MSQKFPESVAIMDLSEYDFCEDSWCNSICWCFQLDGKSFNILKTFAENRIMANFESIYKDRVMCEFSP